MLAPKMTGNKNVREAGDSSSHASGKTKARTHILWMIGAALGKGTKAMRKGEKKTEETAFI